MMVPQRAALPIRVWPAAGAILRLPSRLPLRRRHAFRRSFLFVCRCRIIRLGLSFRMVQLPARPFGPAVRAAMSWARPHLPAAIDGAAVAATEVGTRHPLRRNCRFQPRRAAVWTATP